MKSSHPTRKVLRRKYFFILRILCKFVRMEALFWVSALLAITGAVGMLTHRNPVYSALYLIVNFFALAVLFLSLDSEFLFITQIIVYAGAIMVLFLFVIMLLNLGRAHTTPIRWLSFRSLLALGTAILFLAQLWSVFKGLKVPVNQQHASFKYGKVEALGKELMTRYVFGFELISIVLLVALIGAVVIAKYARQNKKSVSS